MSAVALTTQTVIAVSETVRNLLFPLIILLVGAVISGIFVPRIANAREERRKSLELRTNLVTQITEAVTSFLMAIQFAQQAERYANAHRESVNRLGPATEDVREAPDNLEDAEAESGLADANMAYRRWEIDSAVIGTKLRAYFPESGLDRRWVQFSDDLVLFYGTLGVPEDLRVGPIAELLERHTGGDGDRKGRVHGGLLDTNARMIKTVLTTPPYLG